MGIVPNTVSDVIPGIVSGTIAYDHAGKANNVNMHEKKDCKDIIYVLTTWRTCISEKFDLIRRIIIMNLNQWSFSANLQITKAPFKSCDGLDGGNRESGPVYKTEDVRLSTA